MVAREAEHSIEQTASHPGCRRGWGVAEAGSLAARSTNICSIKGPRTAWAHLT